jgi:putative flippase GtrA
VTLHSLTRFAAYACVGAIGTCAQYVTLAAFVSTRTLGAIAASCVGAIVGALVNYYLNYYLTFRSSRPHRTIAPRFMAIATASLCLNGALMFAFTHWAYLQWAIAQGITTGCVLLLTYAGSSIWTFREPQI